MKNNKNLNYLGSVVSYSNAYTLKKQILSENKGKSGIYHWINRESGKTYIGSYKFKKKI
jgi:hypothetical protein